jgi:hypothetical protein
VYSRAILPIMDASTAKNAPSSPLPTANSPNVSIPSAVSGGTRPPKLLPAFEPISSSPPARSSKKRQYPHDSNAFQQHYPTPVPTSSTGIILLSSPRQTRPPLQRTTSTMSERAPLSDVSTVLIPEDGQQLLLGRSSSSCNFQLPYNRLISRVHVGVTYLSPTREYASGRVMIECLGWNGCKVLCQGRVDELAKDSVLMLSNPDAEIILDVLDTRVILAWPEVDPIQSFGSGSSWLNESPSRQPRRSTDRFASSPPPLPANSPLVSPSPARHARRSLISPPSEGFWKEAVKVYEDPTTDDAKASSPSDQLRSESGVSKPVEIIHSPEYLENENEENEPVVHSFGPFGSNILSRLNSFSASSPQEPHSAKRRKTSQESSQSSPLSSPRHYLSESPHNILPPPPPPVIKKHLNESPIKNHVINQLAFSRVHSTPISSILKALPANVKTVELPPDAPDNVSSELTRDMLRSILEALPCVGEIPREGKDAAGKPLENEFYYIPDRDENTMRRDTVVNGMGSTGLRAVRKSHKVNIYALNMLSICMQCAYLIQVWLTRNISNTSGNDLETDVITLPTTRNNVLESFNLRGLYLSTVYICHSRG